METLLIDYSWSRPNPAQIVASGYSGVLRYLSLDPSKNLTISERNALHGAGLTIGLVWESTSSRALAGAAGGAADVAAAESQADALGYPPLCPIFYAVDMDTTPAAIAPYMHAVQAAARRPVGIYGSATIIEGTDGPLWRWQTSAWSGGRVSSRADIYQRVSPTVAHPLTGTDENVLINAVPLWSAQGAPVGPTATPVPTVAAVPAPPFPLPQGSYFGPALPLTNTRSVSGYYSHRADLAGWQTRMQHRGWTITSDGLYGSQTETVTRAFQTEKGLSVDGLIGAETWAAAWTAPITK